MHLKVLLTIHRMNKQIEDIKAIREMMEKSSKFTSINGLSLILAGGFAVAGGWYARNLQRIHNYDAEALMLPLLGVALVILVLAVGTISVFSYCKARKNHQPLFSSITRRAGYNLLVPLAVGGLFSLLMLLRGNIAIVAPLTLIFYGLALINASKFTFSEIHILGICQVIIGLLAAVFLYNGMIFWIIGFGILHIIFGVIMYVKYDLKKK